MLIVIRTVDPEQSDYLVEKMILSKNLIRFLCWFCEFSWSIKGTQCDDDNDVIVKNLHHVTLSHVTCHKSHVMCQPAVKPLPRPLCHFNPNHGVTTLID